MRKDRGGVEFWVFVAVIVTWLAVVTIGAPAQACEDPADHENFEEACPEITTTTDPTTTDPTTTTTSSLPVGVTTTSIEPSTTTTVTVPPVTVTSTSASPSTTLSPPPVGGVPAGGGAMADDGDDWGSWILGGLGFLLVTLGFLTARSIFGEWWEKWKEPR